MKKFAFLFLVVLSTTITFGQSDKIKVQETVTKSKIEGHIYFLADDLLKGRETGTPENKIAASYLANTLRSYGVKPNPKTGDYYQEVTLQKIAPPKDVIISINGSTIKDYAVLDVAVTDFSKGAVYLGYGLEQDYKGKSVDGKLVIVKAGSADAKDARAAFGLRDLKRELAKQNGAVGVLELLDAQEQMWGFIEHNFNAPSLDIVKEESKKSNMPYVWILDKGSNIANSLSTNKPVAASLTMSDSQKEIVKSQNVIGIVEGTDPTLKNEYIIYSGHYDHVGIGTPDETGDVIYNGARDNAVGTTTVLSMAENLAKYPTKRSALFILFTGEEKGLLGSSFYVENPVLPLEQMVYCFNSDNGGYNDTSLATIIGLPRTTAAQHIKDAASAFGLTAIDDPAPEQGLFDRSDNVNFAAKGIPAPTFSLGFTAFNGDVTKYYHRPGDEANTLDYDYLFKFFSAYVLAGRNIGNDPVTPTWTAGDKYEAAGKALYKN
ncbi:peptidase M28 [Dokdonia pacifica]|uniref:Peptidase family M28 n=1 Tax=Dokdonia pacifica TaxID=1627892 RepID=A0A238WMX4_9FLAO|nr:M28 family peptidase [Dokdonia pacifica]GGG22402.1 peptidase M28 [Dokdonia pacifica]SNR47663.1 Peptidase family M28 [Dokdonia pacifica]